jgi:Kef-type K+ transport system membrane component KefB
MIAPLAVGLDLLMPESPYKQTQLCFLATALAITAVTAAVRILIIDLDIVHSQVGQSIISAAFVDAVLSLLLLAVLTAVIVALATTLITPFLIVYWILNSHIWSDKVKQERFPLLKNRANNENT